MRDLKKTGQLLCVGLLAAGLLYPVLHELGHILPTVLCGADLVEITLFPQPSVLCELSAAPCWSVQLISAGSAVLPPLAARLFSEKRFNTWILRTVLRSISLFAALQNLWAVLSFRFGHIQIQTDVSSALLQRPHTAAVWGIFYSILSVYLWVQLPKREAIRRIASFYGI